MREADSPDEAELRSHFRTVHINDLVTAHMYIEDKLFDYRIRSGNYFSMGGSMIVTVCKKEYWLPFVRKIIEDELMRRFEENSALKASPVVWQKEGF